MVAPGYCEQTYVAAAQVGTSHAAAMVPSAGGLVPPPALASTPGVPVSVHPNAVCTVAQVLPTSSVTTA